MGIWKIIEPWQEMIELFQNKAFYNNEVLHIQSDKRKQEWLAVRLLVKHMTGDELTISYKKNGAPFFTHNPYHISISHTKGYAAVIMSVSPYPGIDIEYKSERACKLRTKFLSTKEMELFDAIHFNDQAESPSSIEATLATLCWCAKETAYKALQETEVDFKEHLHIAPFSLSEKGVLSLKEIKTRKKVVFTIHYYLSDDFVITWKD